MKVLIVTQYFWPENFRINDLAVGLRERGHEISVLTGMPNYPQGRLHAGYGFVRGPYKERFEGIPVYRVPLVTRGPSKGARLALNFASFAASASLLAPLRIRGRFDAMLVYEPSPITVALPAIVLKRLRRTPIALWVQDLWPETLSATGSIQSRAVLERVRSLVRFIYRHCNRLLLSSPGFVEHAIAHGVPPERALYFPNWAEKFYRPMTREEASAQVDDFPATGIRILFAGNLGSSQSLTTVIEAAGRLQHRADIVWVLIGDGNERRTLERLVADRGLQDNVRFLGHRPAEKMPAYFALADGLLVTLRNDPVFALTVPSKLQTYLACARPVLAALPGDGGAVIEQAQAGLACAPDDAQALADVAERFADLDPAERDRMANNARLYFERNFEREMLLDRLEAVLSSMVSETRCAS